MSEHTADEEDLDLSPEMMCLVARRRTRTAALAAASHTDPPTRADH